MEIRIRRFMQIKTDVLEPLQEGLRTRLPILSGCIVFVWMFARVIYFYNMGEGELVTVVPDDAFYYIQMAKHRAFEGLWSFDGASPSSGFHFLYGHLLALLYLIASEISLEILFLIIGFIASISIGFAAFYTTSVSENAFGTKSVSFALLPIFTYSTVFQSTAMMESWLVLLFSSATFFFIFKDGIPSVKESIWLVSVGALGSLSRSDFGLLPGSIFMLFLIGYRISDKNRLKRSVLVLFGAILGVLVVILQNFMISGQFAQTSARVKFYWSSLVGHSFLSPIDLLLRIVFPFQIALSKTLIYATLGIAIVLGVYCALIWFKAEDRRKYFPRSLLFFSGLICIIGYIIFYKYNCLGLHIWYSASFIVPMGIVLAGIGRLVFGEKVLIPGLLLLSYFSFTSVSRTFERNWPHQIGMMNAGIFLKSNFPKDTHAAWNAGIISYFSGLPVVNLDGLANDEVFPYIKKNTLLDYLKLKKIHYIADYETMFEDIILRIRGGYNDNAFLKCVRPIRNIDGGAKGWQNRPLKLYAVDLNCAETASVAPPKVERK